MNWDILTSQKEYWNKNGRRKRNQTVVLISKYLKNNHEVQD